MVDFTVAIPTYNGEKRLPEVLERLRSQTGTEHFTWEIIVVDNNSTDNTANVVRHYQANWPTTSLLKYSFEAEQGAAFARARAVREASGTFIGFLDDDTVPSPDWLVAAYTFGQEHPAAGAYGSQIHGDFEVEPSASFRKVAYFLAIIERGSQAHRYEPRMKMLPPSAGLVVRKQAWVENVPSRPFLTGRAGRSMLTSEDLEALMYIQKAGWEIWYNPNMHISHKIPRHRMERTYLISLVQGIGLARHHIRMLRLKPWQRPLIFPIGLANDLRKVISHFIKYRKLLKNDIAAACEMEFLFSSLISPFYLWSNSLKTGLISLSHPNRQQSQLFTQSSDQL
jgi:glycosyltransferase involved in cell wall biosynthesis